MGWGMAELNNICCNVDKRVTELYVCWQVDIIYEDECLPDYFSLIDVAYTFSWDRVSTQHFILFKRFPLSYTRVDCDRSVDHGTTFGQSFRPLVHEKVKSGPGGIYSKGIKGGIA